MNSYETWLIKHRIYCEHSNGWHACYHHGADVRTFNGRETVLCQEHAGRLDAVRESEKKQETQNQ